MLQSKYKAVLDLGQELNVQDGDVQEQEGLLKIKGKTKTPYEKNLLWDKIKEIGGEAPQDLEADIIVENDSVYHHHTVAKGESLSLIAKHYYGDPMKYKAIFEANTGILKSPDVIQPGQELVIPNL